jgi:AcrR family transcriptional regulator
VTTSPELGARRRYDGTLRRARAEETRERIVAAGAELLRASSIRDWDAVTMRAVAERASVNERTIYRHFANERALRDALMQRLEAATGIDLAQLRLGDIADVTGRIFRHVSSYPIDPRPPLDPTLAATNRRQHDALLAAVDAHTSQWPADDRRLAAAMFDVLWAVGSYERLVVDWEIESEEAIKGISWVINLIADAIRRDDRPEHIESGGVDGRP